MKAAVAAVLLATTPALADEPVELTADQLDRVTAGGQTIVIGPSGFRFVAHNGAASAEAQMEPATTGFGSQSIATPGFTEVRDIPGSVTFQGVNVTPRMND